MSKAYKGKTCVYCLSPNSEDGDHVVSRNFFLPNAREGIPIVPACKACNNEKSTLEHYLTAVLPFGGRHPDAKKNLEEMAPPRLSRNAKLAKILSAGWQRLHTWTGAGSRTEQTTLPFEGERMVRYMEMVVKGLAWDHWDLLFTPDHIVQGSFVTVEGADQLARLFKAKHKDHVKCSLGNGAFTYEAVQSADNPDFTMWRLSLYGVQTSGDTQAPGQNASEIFVTTAHKNSKAAEAVQSLLGR